MAFAPERRRPASTASVTSIYVRPLDAAREESAIPAADSAMASYDGPLSNLPLHHPNSSPYRPESARSDSVSLLQSAPRSRLRIGKW